MLGVSYLLKSSVVKTSLRFWLCLIKTMRQDARSSLEDFTGVLQAQLDPDVNLGAESTPGSICA